MKKDKVNWNAPELVKWLGTTTRKGTAGIYRMAFRAYSDYTGLTPASLIDEAIEDAKLDVRLRKDILKTRILGFHEWLLKEYPVYGRGSEKLHEHIPLRIGLRPKTAHTWVAAIRSFYQTYDLSVKLKGRSRLPKPKVFNKRLQLTIADVKALVDHARSPRDRAIILTMFQGGMDVSTLCDMKYEDVAEGLAKNERPLKVNLHREKTGVDYYTFLGRDAIESIKTYLNDAKSRGIYFKPNTPLFVKEAPKGEPLYPHIVQKLLREVAHRSGLVDGENNGKDINPASPHALRESFESIMINNGVPDTIADFWSGHEIGEMAEAYKGARFEELKKMYAERERFISITVPESEEIERLRTEVEDRNKQLQTLVNGLTARNMELEKQIKPFSQVYQTLVETFGEKDAPERLKELFLANVKGIKQTAKD